MPLTRRDLLLGLGGGAAGVALTPVPWKLLDDVSIWSQHRRALPVPAKGEVSFKPAACTLCPGGCALRVRCVGRQPVAVAAEPKHPLGAGACALGLTLHHLAYHPLRLVEPALRQDGRLQTLSVEQATAALVEAVARAGRAGKSVMLVDRRPGRVVSQAWCELLAGLPGGLYVTLPNEDATFAALQATLAEPAPLGIDLERTRTLLSLGAPVLEGWGRPGRLLALRRQLHVIQADSRLSLSAELADEWLAIAPEAEGPLALALAHVIVKEDASRVSPELRAALAPFAPARVALRVGLEAARIEELAHALVAGSPTIAVGGGEPGAGPLGADAEQAIALLNVALGSVGREGGFVPRRPLPGPASSSSASLATLATVPAGSIGVAILDSADDGRALPWAALSRTLAKDALVVSLSPFDCGLARRATLLLPSPSPLEGWDEVLASPESTRASYALSAPLLRPVPGGVDALALAQRLGAALKVEVAAGSLEDRLKQRVAAIQAAARGRFLARTSSGWADATVADAVAAWDVLAQGGCWIDDPQPAGVARGQAPLPAAATLARWAQADLPAPDLALVAFAGRGSAGETPVSPLMSKLYQETDLRPSAAVAALHPKTAEVLGVRAGRRVWIESQAGRVLAELRCDEALPPGRLALAAGPAPQVLHPGTRWGAEMAGALALVAVGENGTWRGTRVRVREA